MYGVVDGEPKRGMSTKSAGAPGKRARSSSRWEATPTGQLFVWHTRAMMQPVAIIATVPKPNSSPPNAAATMTSRPLRMPPSTRKLTRSRRLFAVSCCHGHNKAVSTGIALTPYSLSGGEDLLKAAISQDPAMEMVQGCILSLHLQTSYTSLTSTPKIQANGTATGKAGLQEHFSTTGTTKHFTIQKDSTQTHTLLNSNKNQKVEAITSAPRPATECQLTTLIAIPSNNKALLLQDRASLPDALQLGPFQWAHQRV